MAKKPAKKVAKKKPGTAVAIHKPQPPAAPKTFLELIAETVRDPSINVDKMERVMAIQREVLADERRRLYNEAMRRAQAEMPTVARKDKGERTPYANLERIAKAIKPIYTKHGFSLSFGSEDSPKPDHYRVTCDVMHEGGEVRHHTADLKLDDIGPKGERNKTSIQGWGSMISYARRYITVMIFNITIAKEDDDGLGMGGSPDTGNTISPDQVKRLQGAMTKHNIPATRVTDYVSKLAKEPIAGITDIPAAFFDETMRTIEQHTAGARDVR